MKDCQKAPYDWYCTREEGHDGPCACAAWPGKRPLKTVGLVTTCDKCQADRCELRHMMDARNDAFCRCLRKAGHCGDCHIEFAGACYAVSPNGYGAHPPRVIESKN